MNCSFKGLPLSSHGVLIRHCLFALWLQCYRVSVMLKRFKAA